jgi:cytochrome c oxidase subunit 2
VPRQSSRRVAFAAGTLVAGAVAAACDRRAPSVLDTHGSEAHRIAGVWWLMFSLATAVYVVVGVLILYGALRGRRQQRSHDFGRREDAFIWIGGVVVPTIILVVLGVFTVRTTSTLRRPSAQAVRVEVVGKDWWWQVRYPDIDFTTANELHLPAGRPVQIDLTSDNVIHSFWVPQLAAKLDTIPGQHNVLTFTPTKPGIYTGKCSQFCGLQHAHMDVSVIVQTPVDFDRWLARWAHPSAEPTSEAEARGQLVFTRSACAGCHTIKGTEATGTLGPDLTDIGERLKLGTFIDNNKGNLGGWVANAQTLKPGNLMPPIALSPADLQAILAYLDSRK